MQTTLSRKRCLWRVKEKKKIEGTQGYQNSDSASKNRFKIPEIVQVPHKHITPVVYPKMPSELRNQHQPLNFGEKKVGYVFSRKQIDSISEQQAPRISGRRALVSTFTSNELQQFCVNKGDNTTRSKQYTTPLLYHIINSRTGVN